MIRPNPIDLSAVLTHQAIRAVFRGDLRGARLLHDAAVILAEPASPARPTVGRAADEAPVAVNHHPWEA